MYHIRTFTRVELYMLNFKLIFIQSYNVPWRGMNSLCFVLALLLPDSMETGSKQDSGDRWATKGLEVNVWKTRVVELIY
jgi:hypothetical protein